MNKEQQEELVGDAYKNYLNNFIEPICHPNLDVQPSYYEPMTKEWFIKSAKEKSLRGDEFSENWGLKIEERELSLEERLQVWNIKFGFANEEQKNQFDPNVHLDTHGVPTKLITITYNDKTIESYE